MDKCPRIRENKIPTADLSYSKGLLHPPERKRHDVDLDRLNRKKDVCTECQEEECIYDK